jgi:hypothetical protein
MIKWQEPQTTAKKVYIFIWLFCPIDGQRWETDLDADLSQWTNHLWHSWFNRPPWMERVMKSFTLIFAAATTLTMVTASNGQAYLNGAPIGGVGTYAPGPGPSGSADDPRFRDNNWRNSSPDNWRDNNWREDRSGWRRNNWRDDRADDWRPYNLRGGQEKEDPTKKKKEETSDDMNGDNCGMNRNRSDNFSNKPCRRQ